MSLRIITTGCFSLMIVGCAPVFKVERDKIPSQLKTAIVGFTLEQEQSNNLTIQFNGKGSGVKAGRDKTDPFGLSDTTINKKENLVFSPHAVSIYDNLREALRRETHLNVVSGSLMSASESYHDIVNHRKKTVMYSTLASYPADYFGHPGILGSYVLSSLSKVEREHLMDVLKVDAVATALVKVRLNRSDSISIGRVDMGSYSPSAITEFELYVRGVDEPVWIDRAAAGSRSEKSVSHVSGMTGSDSLNQSVVKASQKSFVELTKRFLKIRKK